MADIKSKEQAWKEHIKKYSKASTYLGIRSIITTYIPMILLGLLYKYVEHTALFQRYYYYLLPLFVVPQAGLFIRGFMVFHDCCHNSFFASPRWNRITGHFMSILTLTPFEYWQRVHVHHHGNLGNSDVVDEADTIFFTAKQYKEMDPVTRTANRIIREPLVFFTLIPIYPWWIYYPFVIRSPFTLLGQSIFLFLTFYFKMYYLPLAVWLGHILGFILFHLQHGVNQGYRTKGEKWTFFESAYSGSTCLILPKILRFFTLGIEYHHIHHYQTRVPCYRLEECHHEAPEGLWDGVTVVTFRKAWLSLFNVMFDDEKGIFVMFNGKSPEEHFENEKVMKKGCEALKKDS